MSEVQQFRLPDAGEGLTEAEIVSWKVRPGDVVEVNDVIVEIETAKSLVELPSPYAGTVVELLAAEGTTVPVGTPIISVATASGVVAGGSAPGGSADSAVVSAGPGALSAGTVLPPGADPEAELLRELPVAPPGERQAVLVGYGPRTGEVRRRPRKQVPVAGSAPAARAVPVSAASAVPVVSALREPAPAAHVLAKPPVRKLARELGVDLRAVVPTGPGGVVTRADVTAFGNGNGNGGGAPAAPRAASAPGVAWDGPREERVPVRSVRKATAEAMVRSAFTAPHVTEFVTVDVSATMRLVRRLREAPEFAGVKVSPLTILAWAMCQAVRRTPDVNARWDEATGEIVYQRFVNLGIAAATPRGLLVPNIKDADRLGLRDLAVAINALAATAREGRSTPADMTGGTISITNVGVFGVDSGTPILPPGEAAIVCFGAVRKRPWVVGDQIVVRDVTTLGMSFDHRLVDGEQGSRFLADVAALMEEPATALAWS